LTPSARDAGGVKRLSIPKSPACARRSCCRLPWLPQSFSHGPFPTGPFPRAAGSGCCYARAGSRPKFGPPQIYDQRFRNSGRSSERQSRAKPRPNLGKLGGSVSPGALAVIDHDVRGTISQRPFWPFLHNQRSKILDENVDLAPSKFTEVILGGAARRSILQRRSQRVEEVAGAVLAGACIVIAVEEGALLGHHQRGFPARRLQLQSRQRHRDLLVVEVCIS